MNPVSAFLLAHWPLITTYLIVGSLLTKGLGALAKRLPQYPRFTHIVGVIDDVVIDVIGIAIGIGRAIGGTIPPDLQDAAKNAAKGALVLLVCLFVGGCGFFNSGPGKVVECGAASMAQVLSQLCPPPITPICTELASAAFEQACESAASAGANQDEATAAGVKAAKMQLAKLQHDGINLSRESLSR